MMKALVIHNYGSPSELKLESIAKPTLSNDYSVLVKVEYAGINPVDYKIRRGSMQNLLSLSFPAVLGLDYSGTVEAIGARAHEHLQSDIKVGSKVYGKISRPRKGHLGTYAEFVELDVRNDVVHSLPENVKMDEAGGVGVGALTAYCALVEYGKLSPTTTSPAAQLIPIKSEKQARVLVLGASGGVGSYTVQMAHAMGFYVVGVCSGRNIELVKSLGADEVIDYTLDKSVNQQLREKNLGVFDVIVDCVGGEDYFKQTYEFGKRYVTAVGPFKNGGADKVTLGFLLHAGLLVVGRNLAALFGYSIPYSFMTTLNHKLWSDMDKLFAKGLVKTHIDKVFQLEEGVQAHEALEQGRTRGKIVLKI